MKILFLDDDAERTKIFLSHHPEAICVEHAEDCYKYLLSEPWDEVHLDHDLGGKVYIDSAETDTGMEVVRVMTDAAKEHLKETLFIVHSWNPVGAKRMIDSLGDYGYRVVYVPFSYKMVHRS